MKANNVVAEISLSLAIILACSIALPVLAQSQTVISMTSYGTVAITPTSSHAPTASPTTPPKVTPTPSPSPIITYIGTNLAPILDGWDLTYGNPPYIVALDNSVTYNGNPSIRVGPHTSADKNYAREVNTLWIRVHPGDHVVFRVWAKTSNLVNTNYDTGAFCGIDFYGNSENP